MAVVNKKPPSLLLIMYHVFIGSTIKLGYQWIKKSIIFIYKVLVAICVRFWKISRWIIFTPFKGIGRVFSKKSGIVVDKKTTPAGFWLKTWMITCNFLAWLWRGICKFSWWVKHQLALTSLSEIRNANIKPCISLGWELLSEFSPRHRLDFWMGDSHITVEISSFKYDPKRNRLIYTEYHSKKRTHIHSPHGIPHMVSKVHWWEAITEPTTKPYAPLHSVNQKAN